MPRFNPQNPPLEPTESQMILPQKPTKLLKTVLLAFLGLTLVSGIAYGTYWYGKRQVPPPASEVTPPPTTEVPEATSPAENADWKTYEGDFVTFKYPEGWGVGSPQIFGSRSVIDFNYNLTPLFTLSHTGNYNQKTGKPFVDLDEFIGVRIDRAREISVGTHKAKRVTDPGEEGHVIPYEEVLIFTPDNTFIISLYYQESYYDMPGAEQVLDQILSTFKFLEPNQAAQLNSGVITITMNAGRYPVN